MRQRDCQRELKRAAAQLKAAETDVAKYNRRIVRLAKGAAPRWRYPDKRESKRLAIWGALKARADAANRRLDRAFYNYLDKKTACGVKR